jgi:hypothetical protein
MNMQVRRALGVFSVLLLGTALFVPTAKADVLRQVTKITINEPLNVSGTVLAPGSYWFETWDRQADIGMDLIRIYDADFSKLVAIVPTISIQRMSQGYGTALPSPSMNGTELRIAEGAGKQPATLLAWFYPGGYSGHEFIYPPAEEKKLEASRTEVLNLPRG